MRRNMRPPPREEGRIISECQPIRRITVYASAVSAMFNRAFAALFCQIKDVMILLSVLPNVTSLT